ncbi:hypothetical protein UPYG_G00255090 [Umbra pygmaea]|uniref:F-box domain-containing protein n=1 Tax=Umbra pygmaea TaxID=75934 RepID=A0ABD0WD51_UMBPY
MSFAPRVSLTSAKMQTKMSSWTPLNHQLSNCIVFEERRNLLGKWFDKWSDSQRKAVLQDFFSRCSVAQLRFLHQNLTERVPEENLDFTCVLPRVLSLYVFSFLDPRSLSRCAQVSWHWKEIVELDQLWMPKCLRLGWYINFAPTPFEQAVWKRNYIETVKKLHLGKPKSPSQQEFTVPEVTSVNTVTFNQSIPTAKKERALPAPRNLDPIEHARQVKAKSKVMNTDKTKNKAPSAASYKLRKAKSLMFLSLDLSPGVGSGRGQQQHKRLRPQWATQSLEYPVTKATAKSLSQSNQWNAGIRPGPVRSAVPTLSHQGLKASTRTHRSMPTTPLFDGQPGRIPISQGGSHE